MLKIFNFSIRQIDTSVKTVNAIIQYCHKRLQSSITFQEQKIEITFNDRFQITSNQLNCSKILKNPSGG